MHFKSSLFTILAAGAILLLSACPKKQKPGSVTNGSGIKNPKLVGNWQAKDGSKLKITDKTFTEGDAPEAEDYFIKGDTIYTSFEGNLPYTKYAIKKLDEHNLELFTPDSVSVVYTK